MDTMTASDKTSTAADTGHSCRIVIIGANFAGLSTAINLPRRYRATIIDSRSDFEYLPNIHELVSGIKKADSLRLDRNRLIKRIGHRFINDNVTSIDPVKKRIYTSTRKNIPYDLCVVATGGINNTTGISGSAKYAMPFKTAGHCHRIGQRLKELNRSNRQVSVVVVGGGLEGIEALGEILRRYRRNPKLKIHLVEKNERLLPTAPPGLDRDIKKTCASFHVRFHMATRITRVAGNKVWLSSGESLESDATIWTGGAVPSPLLHRSGLTEQPKKWVPVTDTLQSKIFSSIFVAGDAADFPALESKQAYHAIDMGTLVARNIRLLFANEELKTFNPLPKPKIISFGDLQTYVILGNYAVASPFLAGLKEGVFQATMAKIDPPMGISSVMKLYNRASESLFNLTIPSLMSMLSLKKISDIRILT